MPRNRELPSSFSLTDTQAIRACEIVEKHFGPGYWDGFFAYVTEPLPWHEWRFGGQLGFGGKLCMNATGRLYVSCYPEDSDPLTDEEILQVNRKLEEVVQRESD